MRAYQCHIVVILMLNKVTKLNWDVNVIFCVYRLAYFFEQGFWCPSLRCAGALYRGGKVWTILWPPDWQGPKKIEKLIEMIKKYKYVFSFSWGPKFLAAPLKVCMGGVKTLVSAPVSLLGLYYCHFEHYLPRGLNGQRNQWWEDIPDQQQDCSEMYFMFWKSYAKVSI